MSQVRVAIIGAGIAGVSCAQRIAAAGLRNVQITILEKSRGAGGRVSTRRGNDGMNQCDHGAQLISGTDADFLNQVKVWEDAGVCCLWKPRTMEYDGQWSPRNASAVRGTSAGAENYFVGTPKMKAIVESTLSPLNVNILLNSKVSGLTREGGKWLVETEGRGIDEFDVVAIAAPSPQAAALVSPQLSPDMHAICAKSVMQGTWALIAQYDKSFSLNYDIGVVRRGPLSLIVRDSGKPGRSVGSKGDTLILHASPEWSEENLENSSEEVAKAMINSFCELGGQRPVEHSMHRWRYAFAALDTVRERTADFHWDQAKNIGICGDWLSPLANIEGAWLSGRSLGQQIIHEIKVAK